MSLLPSVKSTASIDFKNYPYIFYGERGIGKSTFADMFYDGNALFCMFENDRSLNVYKKSISSWKTFCDIVDEYTSTKNQFTGMVIDNGAVAYELAMQHACDIHGFDHPGQVKDYGASWSKVKKIFKAPFQKLFHYKKGFIIICHELREQIEDDTGLTFYKVRPDWATQADSYLSAFCENIFYYHFHGEDRYLQIEGNSYITAKNKFSSNFKTTGGMRVCRIPMGISVQQSVKNFMSAWNNEQANTFRKLRKEEERAETRKSEISFPEAKGVISGKVKKRIAK